MERQQRITAKTTLQDDGSRNIYYKRGRKNLIITIGDSWTYGDSLGDRGPHPYRPSREWDENNEYFTQARTEQCWGRHVADAMLADWFECSTRGCDNNHILHEAEWWCSQDATPIFDRYDRVYICVILTELGRACHHYWDGEDPMDLLIKEDNNIQQRLNRLRKNKPPRTYFWFGRNMTRSYAWNQVTRSPWIDVIAGKQVSQQGWLSGVASHKMADLYLGFTVPEDQQQLWKQHFVEQTELVRDTWHHLQASKLHYSGHTCHPKAQGHKMYADYVTQFLKQNAGW